MQRTYHLILWTYRELAASSEMNLKMKFRLLNKKQMSNDNCCQCNMVSLQYSLKWVYWQTGSSTNVFSKYHFMYFTLQNTKLRVVLQTTQKFISPWQTMCNSLQVSIATRRNYILTCSLQIMTTYIYVCMFTYKKKYKITTCIYKKNTVKFRLFC